MKTFRKILIFLIGGFTFLLTIGILLISYSTFKLQFEFTSNGFSVFIAAYEPLKQIFTIDVALMTVFFIMFQIENIRLSTERTEKILNNELKNKILEMSKFFYVDIQALLRVLLPMIEHRTIYLLHQKWTMNDFTDQSILEQNPKWEKEYEELQETVKPFIIDVLNNLEYLSSNILKGNVDKELAFQLFGRPFCVIISSFYPFVSAYRSREKAPGEDYYDSIVILFQEWNAKRV
jgi:hypothetical protein